MADSARTDPLKKREIFAVSDSFFTTLREQLRSTIAQLQLRVDKITTMHNPNASQTAEKNDKQRVIRILAEQLTEIEALLVT